MKYISDDIGEEYKEWTSGQSVFIASPTGSGKTTFIFDTLLPYYASKNRKILYLVNRSVLKKQLEKRVANLPIEYKGVIHVETYQALEEAIVDFGRNNYTPDYCNGYAHAVKNLSILYNLNSFPKLAENIQTKSSEYLAFLASFDCVVCDECHYFLSDSNFNKKTILSYNFVRKNFGYKYHIFISATIKDIKKYIYDGKPLNYLNRTEWFGLPFFTFIEGGDVPKEYSGDRQYDYIDLHFIKHTDEILQTIESEDSKWLVFVDNKKLGEELRKRIIDEEEKNSSTGKKARSVSFITADYSADEDSLQQVINIVKDEKQDADILISTSVLDNGINISDDKLRNLIIMADNETEFIQMLGRRRQGTERVALYAFLYDKGHFQNRHNINSNRNRMGSDFLSKVIGDLGSSAANGQNIIRLNEHEKRDALQHSRYLIENIFSYCEKIKYTHFSYNGMLHLNPLSVHNLRNMNDFYLDMIKRFEYGDEDAFAKEVIRWLNLEDKIDLEYAKKAKYEKCRQCVIELFEANVNKPLEKKAYELTIRKPIEKELAFLIENKKNEISPDDYDKFSSDCCRSGRVITGPMMKFLKTHCDITFDLKVEKSIYTIIKADYAESKEIQQSEPDSNPQN